MVSVVVFLLTFAQLALAGVSYLKDWSDVFNLIFVHCSPVMVFFGGIEALVNFSGEFSFFFFQALGYSVLKYVLLAISLRGDELGFFNVGALIMEILFIAASGMYVVYYSYL